MKHRLTGVGVLAALAFVAPAGAQQASPSGGNALGLPGPNPGGPGLTPYSTGPSRPAAAPASGASAPSATAPSPPPSTSASTSATPPKHRYTRHPSHGNMAGHYHGKGAQLTGGTANQLNQEELARLQAGNYSNPPVPPGTAPPPPPGGTMPSTGPRPGGTVQR